MNSRVLTDDADLSSALSGRRHFTKSFHTLPRFNPHTDPQGLWLPVLSPMSQQKLRDGKDLPKVTRTGCLVWPQLSTLPGPRAALAQRRA